MTSLLKVKNSIGLFLNPVPVVVVASGGMAILPNISILITINFIYLDLDARIVIKPLLFTLNHFILDFIIHWDLSEIVCLKKTTLSGNL